MLDVDLGYVPPIFMVFDVTVVNKTYSKIEFDPAKTRITTDTGRTLRYYDPGRAGEGVDPQVEIDLAPIIRLSGDVPE